MVGLCQENSNDKIWLFWVVDGVIEGLEIALTSMRKGEISMVAINYKESTILCFDLKS